MRFEKVGNLLLALVAALLVVVQVDDTAWAIVIDNFDDPAASQTLSVESGTDSSQATGSMLGGFRDLTITHNGGTGTASVGAGGAPSFGTFDVANAAGVTSTVDVLWDSNGSGLGVNLLAGGADAFTIDVINTDQNSNLSIVVADINNNTSSSSATPTSLGTLVFNYSGFVGSADFTTVESIQLTVTNTAGVSALDLQLDDFETTPEPSAFLLLGMVCVGLCIYRRCQKRSKKVCDDNTSHAQPSDN